jgi:hypothetical protein
MNKHEFEIKDKQRSNLPDFLKTGQNTATPGRVSQIIAFNKIVHINTIGTHNKQDQTIITITDDLRTFSRSAVITDSSPNSTISAIWNYWCKPYGYPETISFKQGKVQTSKLEKMINDLAPLEHRVSCRSRNDTFNTEVEQQWQQSQHETSEEEFVHTLNFFYGLQEPRNEQYLGNTTRTIDNNYEDLTEANEDTGNDDEPESDFGDLEQVSNEQPTNLRRRKSVSQC